LNGNPLSTPSPYYHPLPKQFAWADNYVSAVGLLQPGAANVILTNEFPVTAPDPVSWFKEFASFHGYPLPWYEETIESDVSAMGFLWSFERGGLFSQAPSEGSVYVQTFNNSQWNLSSANWSYGTNLLNARFQEYRNGVVNSIGNQVPGLISANGAVNAQIVGALPAFDAFIVSLFTTPSPDDPAYAWMQLAVPSNAVSMSFNYIIRGGWANDSLAAAFNGTNDMLLAGSEIETNVLFNSGSIDVSAFAGQTNEFFVGIIGSTSTNAQLTVQNFVFYTQASPQLQASVAGNGIVMTWPFLAQGFTLQSTTNLANNNSWTTLTNLPTIVGLQNTVTDSISIGSKYYRLIK